MSLDLTYSEHKRCIHHPHKGLYTRPSELLELEAKPVMTLFKRLPRSGLEYCISASLFTVGGNNTLEPRQRTFATCINWVRNENHFTVERICVDIDGKYWKYFMHGAINKENTKLYK